MVLETLARMLFIVAVCVGIHEIGRIASTGLRWLIERALDAVIPKPPTDGDDA